MGRTIERIIKMRIKDKNVQGRVVHREVREVGQPKQAICPPNRGIPILICLVWRG